MAFQSQVNLQPAPGVAGDFASANPRATVPAGPGGLVTGASGVTVGRFAWIESDGKTVDNFGASPAAPNGFVARTNQALITTFLAETSNLIPTGLMVTLFNAGDFWATNTGPGATVPGDAVYATFADGSVTTVSAAAGGVVTGSIGGVVTGSIGSSFTATGAGTNLTVSGITGVLHVGDIVAGTGIPVGTTIISQTSGTAGSNGVYVTSVATTASAASCTSTSTIVDVTAVSSGTLQPTDVISGTGITAGTSISSQISGTVGSTGTYRLSGLAQSFASGTITSLSTVLNVTAVTSGALAVGDPVTGTNVTANSVLTAILTGVGGIGTYKLSKASTTVSETITAVGGVLTSFKVRSAGAVGELIKISTWG